MLMSPRGRQGVRWVVYRLVIPNARVRIESVGIEQSTHTCHGRDHVVIPSRRLEQHLPILGVGPYWTGRIEEKENHVETRQPEDALTSHGKWQFLSRHVRCSCSWTRSSSSHQFANTS
ncbi:hypothetical protein OG21DRAFT_1067028 [Imleria badia]|nr:hypothetical protein OG21DRAFT_1067028 [Imleria badia]